MIETILNKGRPDISPSEDSNRQIIVGHFIRTTILLSKNVSDFKIHLRKKK